MSSDFDILLKLNEDEWSLIRHYEDQRATVTNFVLAMASLAIGFLVQKGLALDTLPVAILLIVLGVYGAITVAKLYERTQYAAALAKSYMIRLSELYPSIGLEEFKNKVDVKHRSKFPITARLHMHHLWGTLHIVIALVGVVLTIVILV
jgi:hypothetical protein